MKWGAKLTIHYFNFIISRTTVICGTYKTPYIFNLNSVNESVGLNDFFWIYHVCDSKGK